METYAQVPVNSQLLRWAALGVREDQSMTLRAQKAVRLWQVIKITCSVESLAYLI